MPPSHSSPPLFINIFLPDFIPKTLWILQIISEVLHAHHSGTFHSHILPKTTMLHLAFLNFQLSKSCPFFKASWLHYSPWSSPSQAWMKTNSLSSGFQKNFICSSFHWLVCFLSQPQKVRSTSHLTSVLQIVVD